MFYEINSLSLVAFLHFFCIICTISVHTNVNLLKNIVIICEKTNSLLLQKFSEIYTKNGKKRLPNN